MCAAVALVLGLTCVALTVAVSTDMADMSGMAAPSAASLPAMTTLAATADPPVVTSPQESSMCIEGCGGVSVGVLCMGAAAGLALASALALYAYPRALSWVTRLRPYRLGPTRRRLCRRIPGVVLSPVALCVFRV